MECELQPLYFNFFDENISLSPHIDKVSNSTVTFGNKIN